MNKSFNTLHVASAMTGIGLCEGLNYSKVQEIMSHALGRPIWTHEIAHRPTIAEFQAIMESLFPDMPTEIEARSDFQAAAKKAVAAYGETVRIPFGETERPETPVETLQNMIGPDKKIIIAEIPDDPA